MNVNFKFTIVVITAAVFSVYSCAVKDRNGENVVGKASSSSVVESAKSDVALMEQTATDIITDGTPLVPFMVPAADCTGDDCESIANACSIFNRSNALIASYLYKSDAYLELGISLDSLVSKLNTITMFTFTDGQTIDAVLNEASQKAILESICSMKMYEDLPGLLSRMTTVETSVSTFQAQLTQILAMSGLVGPTGPTGPTGATGAQGPQGPQGDPGPAGTPGNNGSQGIQGPIGLTGPQGDAGSQGIQGPIGLTGPTGSTGPQGVSACVTTGVCTDSGFDVCCVSPLGIASGVWFRAGTKSGTNCIPDAPLTDPPTSFICGYVIVVPGS